MFTTTGAAALISLPVIASGARGASQVVPVAGNACFEPSSTEWDAGRLDGECGRRTLSGTSWLDSPRRGLPTIRSSDGVSTR